MEFFKQRKKELLIVMLVILLMAGVCLLLYQPMMDVFQNPQALRQQLQDYGVFGWLIFVGIMILQVIFVFLPGEIV